VRLTLRMSERRRRVLVLDACAIIDLCKLNALEKVLDLPEVEFVAVENVVAEIRQKDPRARLDACIESGALELVALTDEGELSRYAQLLEVLDDGESASIAWAAVHGARIVSDERNEEFFGEIDGVLGWGGAVRTPDLLALVAEAGLISVNDLSQSVSGLQQTVRSRRDRDDLAHLKRVMSRVQERLEKL